MMDAEKDFEDVDTGLVPTHGAWTVSQIVGVSVGGTLLVVTLVLMGIGLALTNGWVQ